MVIAPCHTSFANLCNDIVRELGPKTKVMDLVGERVLDTVPASIIVFEVVYVHVSIAERLARSKVKVADDLVDADAAFDAAAFAALLVELFAVVFALALLDVLPSAKGPRHTCVSFADFCAGAAASGFYSIFRRGSTVAIAAVRRIEMRCGFVVVSINTISSIPWQMSRPLAGAT